MDSPAAAEDSAYVVYTRHRPILTSLQNKKRFFLRGNSFLSDLPHPQSVLNIPPLQGRFPGEEEGQNCAALPEDGEESGAESSSFPARKGSDQYQVSANASADAAAGVRSPTQCPGRDPAEPAANPPSILKAPHSGKSLRPPRIPPDPSDGKKKVFPRGNRLVPAFARHGGRGRRYLRCFRPAPEYRNSPETPEGPQMPSLPPSLMRLLLLPLLPLFPCSGISPWKQFFRKLFRFKKTCGPQFPAEI